MDNELPPEVAAVLIGPERLAKLVEEQKFYVEHWLSPGTKDVVPHLIVYHRDGALLPERMSVFILNVEFNEDDEKRQAMEGIGRKMYEAKTMPLAALFWGEAWRATEKTTDKHIQPRYHPQRQEIVLIAGLDLNMQHGCFVAMPIQRTRADEIIPGRWEELQTGAEFPLLEHFFRGFMRAAFDQFSKRN